MDEFSKVLEETIDTLQDMYHSMPVEYEHTGLQVEVSEGEWEHSDLRTWRAWTGRRRVWNVEYHGHVYVIDSKDDSLPYAGKRTCRCSVCQTHVAAAVKSN